MSTTPDINTQYNVSTSIKLPPIFMQAFYIDDHQAKCKKCNNICMSTGKDILFHLVMCNGSLVADKIETEFKFNCLMCNFLTEYFDAWKNHIFTLNHISKDYNSSATKYSYDCNSCNTHFYGFKNAILDHRCKPKSLSILSELMAYVSENFDIQHKRMLYYCSDCQCYSDDVTNLHVVKHCKASKNQKTLVCKTCLITFYDCSTKPFLNHKVSFEHMALWSLNGKRVRKNRKSFIKLPVFINKYFEFSDLLCQIRCIVCYEICTASYDCIYDHYKSCISSNEKSNIDNSTPLKIANCDVCNYLYSTEGNHMYNTWVNHVTSFEHLSKTLLLNNKKQKLYSYYCFVSKTIFYGTDYFINKQILLINNKNGHSLFLSEVMNKVYRLSNTYLNSTVLFGCGFCLNIKVHPLKNNCEHENINPRQLFYCSTCLVKFNLQTHYSEHLLSSEHIILKYFKPNQKCDLINLDHYMKTYLKTMKMCLSSKIESDEDSNEYISSSDQSSNDEEMYISFNDIISESSTEFQNVPSELHSFSNAAAENNMEIEINNKKDDLSNQFSITSFSEENPVSCVSEVDCVSNCMKKLSIQSQKSALNNYLRMKFELLNQMPHAINIFIESSAYFCAFCDSVFSDKSGWTKHNTQFHDKIDNLLVFYCAICHIYHISISIKISDHIQTVEHSVMLEFQAYINNNTVKPITNDHNINATTLADDRISNEEYADKKYQNAKKNENTFIEIKDVNMNLKQNNYDLLNQLIKEKYGNFKNISNISNSFIIIFDYTNQIYNMINDKAELEKHHKFKIHILEEDRQKLSLKTKKLFSDWDSLELVVKSQLQIMELNSGVKVNKLCDSVCSLIIGSASVDVHVFGSQMYRLATENSDVDIYLDIDGTFNGDIADDINRQIDLVKTFAKQCYLKYEEFKNIEEICDARVPIIKFYHVPTMINCDVSFKSGLSLYNSKLIKLYLSLDNSVKWLVYVVVKLWALENNLKDRTLFTSYALVWLVLFYLMTKNIIPPLIKLVKSATKDDKIIIEGWDCTFGKCSGSICNVPDRRKLLLSFFQYYANKSQLQNRVLSTLTGKIICKKEFFQFCYSTELSKIQREKLKSNRLRTYSNFSHHSGLAVHDPFELSFNITKNINDENLTNFCELCDQTVTLLKSI